METSFKMSSAYRFFAYILILHTVNLIKTTTTKESFNNTAALRQNNFWEWLQGIIRPPVTTTTPVPAAARECTPCQCGLMNRRRIVGGQETKVNAYPWMTLLLEYNVFACGGTLINDRYVLTAAHCIDGFNPRYMTIRLLEHDLQNSSADVITRNVAEILMHEDYEILTYDNDLALLRLTEPVEWSDLLRPICLPPNSNRDYAGEIGIVTGWGRTGEGGPTSDKLMEVEVPILSQEACHNSSYDPLEITDNMLCAGYDEGGKDSCQSDSGGPLHVKESSDQEHYSLVGVVSWGNGCGRPNTPGIYTRVTRYLDWISQRTGDECGCDMMEMNSNQKEE